MGTFYSQYCPLYSLCFRYESVGGEEDERERAGDDDEWIQDELLSSLAQTRRVYDCIARDPVFMDTVEDAQLKDVYEYGMRKLEKDMQQMVELKNQETLVRQTLNGHHKLTACSSAQLSKRLDDTGPLLHERLKQLTIMMENLRRRIEPQNSTTNYIKEELTHRGCLSSSSPDTPNRDNTAEEQPASIEEEPSV